MIYVYKDRKIQIEWTVLRGTSTVREDFSRALLKLFLIGPNEKYFIDATTEGGVISAEILHGLPEGSYSLEAIWYKNWNIPVIPENHPHPAYHPYPQDGRFNNRCLARSRVDYVFTITDYSEEQDAPGDGPVPVKLKSSTATYGYDGLSAYEIAVMHEKFYGTESDWLEWQHNKMIDYFAKTINYVYLVYKSSPQATRNSLPNALRRKGIIICYENEEGEVITEKAVSVVKTSDDYWGLDTTWGRIDELSLSGDISVSSNGTWVINGKDTDVPSVGPKGRDGLTPWLKTMDNKLFYGYDGETWYECSDYIAAWFRFEDNKIQISRDKETWSDLTSSFTQDLYIKGYLGSIEELPSDAKQGDIYMIGEAAPYVMYVYNNGEWVNNGPFTSIPVGVVQEPGDQDNVVMSQKACTDFFFPKGNLHSISEDDYAALKESGQIDANVYYFIYEEE